MAELREKPLSYIEWVQIQSTSITDEADLFTQYRTYVNNFYSDKRGVSSLESDSIVTQYVDLLKNITLNFTTIEERRFLSNIDFNNKHEIELAVPFYVKKIKQITQYLVRRRNAVTESSIRKQFRGSEQGTKNSIRDTVIDLLLDPDFKELYPTTVFPDLSSINKNISIDVEPLYDNYQHYFDVDPDVDREVYVDEKNDQLYDLFVANVEQKNPGIWVDLDRAISDLFSQIPDVLLVEEATPLAASENLQLAANIRKTVDDLDRLPREFFTGQEKTIQNLSLDQQRVLSEKFSGTDFYYLSTGSTATDYVSGVLYKAENPAANYLNRYWSSHAVVSNKLNLTPESNIGLFFTPNKQGILNYKSFEIYYEIEKDDLVPNAIYIFPDPTKFAAGRGNTKVDQSSPLEHYEDVSSVKATRLNHLKEGEVVNDDKLQKLYPYQSKEESLLLNDSGISRSTDNFDFWVGEEKDIWSNPDVYKIQPLSTPPFDKKIEDLIVTDTITYEWKSDIFGNNYALLKNTKPVRKTSEQESGSLINSATQSGVANENESLYVATTGTYTTPKTPYYNYQLSNFTTEFKSRSDVVSSVVQPYDRKNVSLGDLYFRNVHSTEIGPASSSSLSAVFEKYSIDTNIFSEINNNIINFDVIKDVIIIETSSFLILEKFTYDFETDTFSSVLPTKVMMSLSGKDSNFEKFGNVYYIESRDEILLTKTVLHPFLSGTNYKIIYPEILKFNNNNNTSTNTLSLKTMIGVLSTDNINEHFNTYKVLSGKGFVIPENIISHVEEPVEGQPTLYFESSLPITSSEFINIMSINTPMISLNEKENTLSINFFAKDSGSSVYMFNQYYDITNKDEYDVKKLDLFKPDTDIFNFNVHGYLGHTGTDAPVVSSIVEGTLIRGGPYNSSFVSFDSFKSQLQVPVGNISDEQTYDMSYTTILSGRENTPTRLFDFSNNSVRMGVGVSASTDDEVILGTDEATFTHQSSYLALSPSLSGVTNDIVLTFDFALFTLTSGNSGYAQISQHLYNG